MPRKEISKCSEDEILAVGRVLRTLSEHETDGSHVDTLVGAWERMIELYGDVVWPDDADPTMGDVQTAFDVLSANSPTESEKGWYKEQHDRRHPDRVFGWALEFVDNEAKYVNGVLPEPRTHRVVYKDKGTREELDTREYDHADEIPTRPTIDGTEYTFGRRTTTDDGDTLIYVTEADDE